VKELIENKTIRIFLICLAALIVGIFLAFVSQMAVQAIGVVMSSSAIFGGMFTLIRDEMQRYHKQLMQEQNQAFSLGAMSHMANITFDKHVEFCEEYVKEFKEVMHDLSKSGVSKECYEYAGRLYKIRESHILWISDQVNNRLVYLERCLRKIGVGAEQLERDTRLEERIKMVDIIHEIYCEICEIEGNNEKSEQDKESQIAESKILNNLRKLLEVEDMTEIRKSLISRAVKCKAKDEDEDKVA